MLDTISYATPRRMMLVIAAAIAIFAIAYSGFSLSKAAVPPVAQDYADTLTNMANPVAGTAMVAVDQENGVVCAKTLDGRTSGGACTSTDSTIPMVMESGGSLSDPAHIVVVDPQQRLGSLLMSISGQEISAASSDGGFSIDVTIPDSPDSFTVLDRDGNTLNVGHPKAAQEKAQQEARPLQ